MNLKNIMIISADNIFRKYIVRGFSSIIKSLSAFVLSFIILTSSVFSQYLVTTVSAAEVGAIVAVDLIVELAVTGGIVAGIMRGAQILQGEIESGHGFGSSGLDDYSNSVNQQIIDGVNNGTITNAEAGTVNKLSGVPVEIICPVYGIYQFLCTNELCNKIRMENPQTEEGVKQIVSAYWSSVNILDQRTFEEIASDPKNWVTNLDQLNTPGIDIVAQSVFDSYGQIISSPSSDFFQTGNYGYLVGSNWTQYTNVGTSSLSNYNDFVVITIPDANGRFYFTLYGHAVSQVSPSVYHNLSSGWLFIERYRSYTAINNLRSLSISFNNWKEVYPGDGAPIVQDVDLSLFIDNWGDIWGIEATDAIDLIDWCLGDSRFWNTDVIDLAVDEIADSVDAKVETGEDAGSVDVPLDLPIDIPIEGEGDVAFPGTDSEEDFDDPPAYPGTDEWADVDETDWPSFDPDPDDPNNPDDPDDPDNPVGDEPPLPPELILPVLGGLFPFCIPQDVYNTIRVFNSTVEEPIWDIPLNLSVGSRQLTNTNLHIDLTQNGLDTFFSVLRAVQIVVFIIGLAVFTKQFIF